MTYNTENFDSWIRGDFVHLNTALEELYFATENPEEVDGIGEDIKKQLVEDGKAFIVELLNEGNTDEGFDAGFDVLGNVGFYMAACRRHEITEPSRETKSPLVEASALSMNLGASLGVVPRFASAHLETHNRAISGVYKTLPPWKTKPSLSTTTPARPSVIFAPQRPCCVLYPLVSPTPSPQIC